MATRAEQYRATEQRKKSVKAAKKKKSKAKRRSSSAAAVEARDKKHAEKKATVALEATTNGDGTPAKKRSRKSTRTSANRGKADAPLNIRDELKRSSPENRYAASAPSKRRARPRASSANA